jgi:hypothetical protein
MSYPFQPGPPPGHQPPVARPDEPVAGPSSETGHPAVDAVLRSLENAAQLPPAEQIAEFEAAHQVLQETLASIDG